MLFWKNVGDDKIVPLLADCFQKKPVLDGKTFDDVEQDLSRQTINIICLCLGSIEGKVGFQSQEDHQNLVPPSNTRPYFSSSC